MDDVLFPVTRSRSGFTLIELLVVIAIIAILAVVVVLTLNPAQLLAQSRDANRVSEMATLNSAISLYQTDIAAGGLGSLNTIYTSLPDAASSTCGSLGFAVLPPLYSYHCVTSANLRLASSSGWIPVNFNQISAGAPFGSVPVDPVNSSSSHLYYTYTTNSSQYEVTAGIESTKYKVGGSSDVISSDGGSLATVYEKGTGLGLEPLDYGDPSLVGYWPMDENSLTATTTGDMSGLGDMGQWAGTASGTVGYYSPGIIGASAGYFDGTTNYVKIPVTLTTNAITYVLWLYPKSSESQWTGILVTRGVSGLGLFYNNTGNQIGYDWDNDDPSVFTWPSGIASPMNQWSFVALVISPANAVIYLGTNGQLSSSIHNYANISQTMNGTTTIGFDPINVGNRHFYGEIDDVRIYNRALSAAEIQALYNARK